MDGTSPTIDALMRPTLEDLSRDAQEALAPVVALPMKSAIAKVRYSHQAMVDLIIANPWISQNEIATHFGYTPAWVSRVIASDAFQAALESRRDEVVDPTLKLSIEEGFKAIVRRSFEILQDKMAGPSHTVSDNVALRVAELGGKVIQAQVANGNRREEPSGDRLSALAERLRGLKKQVDSEPIEVVPREGVVNG